LKLQKPLEGLQLEQGLLIFFTIFESVAPGGEQENYEGPGEGGAAYAVPKNKANKAELSINKYGQFLFRNLHIWYFTDREHLSRVESFGLNKEYRRILLSSYSAPISPQRCHSQSVSLPFLSLTLFSLCVAGRACLYPADG
jgi:hypothetical protein